MSNNHLSAKKNCSISRKSISIHDKPDESYLRTRNDAKMFDSDITTISPYSFFNDREVKEVFFPSTITEIGDYAFSECYNLRRLVFDKSCSLIRIGKHAFSSCKSLETIFIPPSVQVMDTAAFKSCISLRTVHFSESSNIEDIGAYAFENCTSLVSISIPNQVKVIQESTFYNCYSLREFVIPASVMFIKEFAFFTKGPLRLIIEDSDVLIDELALYGIPANSIKYAQGLEDQ